MPTNNEEIDYRALVVRTLSRRAASRTVPFDEAVAAGLASVAKGLANYDAKKNASLKTHLINRTRGAVMNENRAEIIRRKRFKTNVRLDLFSRNGDEVDEIDLNERAQIIRDALDKLDDEQKNILVARFYQCLTLREIGNLFGLSYGKTRRAIDSALKTLKNVVSSQISRF